mgnify:CR=1 FL=1
MVIGSIKDILLDIGTMLHRERLRCNLSQETVAKRSAISVTSVKNLENGKDVSLSTFIQACRILGKDEWIMRLGSSTAVSIADYARRGGQPRLRASRAKKVTSNV